MGGQAPPARGPEAPPRRLAHLHAEQHSPREWYGSGRRSALGPMLGQPRASSPRQCSLASHTSRCSPTSTGRLASQSVTGSGSPSGHSASRWRTGSSVPWAARRSLIPAGRTPSATTARPAGRQQRPAASHHGGGLPTSGLHQLLERRAAPAVAGHRWPPPARVRQRLGHHVLGVGAERAGDLHDLAELALLPAEPELADLAVGGIGQDHRQHQLPGGRLVEQLQRELRTSEKAVSSITHAAGVMAAVMRSASRRRTGTGAQGDWLTNCCSACSNASALAAGSPRPVTRPSARLTCACRPTAARAGRSGPSGAGLYEGWTRRCPRRTRSGGFGDVEVVRVSRWCHQWWWRAPLDSGISPERYTHERHSRKS